MHKISDIATIGWYKVDTVYWQTYYDYVPFDVEYY